MLSDGKSYIRWQANPKLTKARHFKKFSESPTFPTHLTKSICLAITPASVKSFTKSNPSVKGDFGGFITAIDASFKPEENNPTTQYDGSFKIIDQLIWTDLYGMHIHIHCMQPKDFWSLGKEHPWGLYVGMTTDVSRRNWRRKMATSQQPAGDDELDD